LEDEATHLASPIFAHSPPVDFCDAFRVVEVTGTFFLVENPKLVEAASAVVVINAAFNVA